MAIRAEDHPLARALALRGEHGVRSDRAAALVFETHAQDGSINVKTKALTQAHFASRPPATQPASSALDRPALRHDFSRIRVPHQREVGSPHMIERPG